MLYPMEGSMRVSISVVAMALFVGCEDVPCDTGTVWCQDGLTAACADDGQVVEQECPAGDTCHEGIGPTGSMFIFCAP